MKTTAYLKNDKGVVMVVAVFAIMLLIVFITGILDVVLLEAKSTANYETQQLTYYKAYSAMNWLVWEFKKNSSAYSSPGQKFSVDLDELGVCWGETVSVKTTGPSISGNTPVERIVFYLYPNSGSTFDSSSRPKYELIIKDNPAPKYTVESFVQVN